MPSARTKIICLTPIRNEGWVLDSFLRAAEMWADHIILADQRSTDDSATVATRFRKVRLITNDSGAFDENVRQRLLLAAAREIEGPKLLVALDADEFLTPTWHHAPEWQSALRAAPGTVFSFDWVNVLPGTTRAYIPAEKVPFAFCDDGSDHHGGPIHARRIPVPPSAPIRAMRDVKVLHLQFTDWQRMKSKQRWYQCWEWLHNPGKRPIQLYRQYHRMDAFPEDEVHAMDPAWLERYADWGIPLGATASRPPYWWDEEVLGWIIKHGTEMFRRLDIWDVPWGEIASALDVAVDTRAVADPRSRMDRAIHRWLARTQHGAGKTRTRQVQRALALLGW